MAHAVASHQTLSQLAKLHRLLAEAGLTEQALQKPIDDVHFRRRLTRFWMSRGFEYSPSQTSAFRIMGRNYVSVGEIVERFGLEPNKAQLEVLENVPFSEGTLKACKNSHLLVPVFPLSAQELSQIPGWPMRLRPDSKLHGGWCLVTKEILPDSTNKTWEEQQYLLKGSEQIPTLAEMFYVFGGEYDAVGIGDVYIRTDSTNLSGSRCIGSGIEGDTSELSDFPDDKGHPLLGVVTIRYS